jgi:hypothetical protein
VMLMYMEIKLSQEKDRGEKGKEYYHKTLSALSPFEIQVICIVLVSICFLEYNLLVLLY